MNKKKYFYLALILMICMGILFLIRGLIKKPIEWTRENSLMPSPIPVFSDRKGDESLIRAINHSLHYFQDQDPQTPVYLGPDIYTLGALRQSLVEFRDNLFRLGLSDEFFRYVREKFIWYRTPAKKVIFTGYYEASLRGSRSRSEEYRFPLYRKPDDLIRIDLSSFYFFPRHRGLPATLRGRAGAEGTIIPYFTREEIDVRQKLSGKNLEIAWADNLMDVFFLHIQGSGVVTLDNGEPVRVNYEESNGHPYRAIGKLLIDRGKLDYENLSLQLIRKYLKNHPQEIREVLNYNPSYIFFKEVEEGPLGSLGFPLTPFRSIATDKRLFPPGALAYVETEIPVFEKNGLPADTTPVMSWKKFNGFVLNQDTGGAIRGAGKIDLFTGYGEESEWIAGHMKQTGTFYFLIKKPESTGSIPTETPKDPGAR
jgi:membrane-bound lytic murein transglycosylase A